jgi:protein TonB
MKFLLASFFVLAFSAVHAQTDSAVYFNTQIPAMYPGGDNAFARYVQENDMSSKGISGVVVVKFIVDSTGKSHDISVVSGPEALRNEAIRLIKKVDKWVPGIANGKMANTWKFQSIEFK